MAARILIFTSIPILLLYWKGIFNDVELPKSIIKTSIILQTKDSNFTEVHKNEKLSSESIEFKLKSTSLHNNVKKLNKSIEYKLKSTSLHNNVKKLNYCILIWNSLYSDEWITFQPGYKSFKQCIENSNCYTTKNKTLLDDPDYIGNDEYGKYVI